MKRQPGSFAPAGTLIRRGRGVTPITEGPTADAAWGAGASMMASAGTNGDESPGPPRLDTPDRHHPRDPDRVASPAR